MTTLTAERIAEILHISKATVLTRLSTHPESLPPRLHIPGQRKPLWLQADVDAWLESARDPVRKGRPRGQS